MLNLQPGVCVAELRLVSLPPLQKTRTPLCAQTIQSAGDRRSVAASLQEMRNGSFAVLSNRVNELNLPTICSSPKESATYKRWLCNGWTCRKAALHQSFCSVWSSSVADGSSNLSQTFLQRGYVLRFCQECSVSIPNCSHRRPHYSSSCVTWWLL